MPFNMILTGDINLLGVKDPTKPFSLVAKEFLDADVVFGNLECCLYDAPGGGPHNNPAFFAPSTAAGEALKLGGVQAVGIANNVNFGELPIKASIQRLDELGIQHTGAGANLDEARLPVILKRGNKTIGILQRTSVYWSANHEAKVDAPGVAVIRGNTAYQLPLHREVQPMNRPGVAPVIITWTEPEYLQRFRDDISSLRKTCDVVVASVHWGNGEDVLQYMGEIAHTAIDAGADVVMGHGPHDHVLPIEVYKGKPIFYGMGALSFYTGHGGRKHGWTGLLVKLAFSRNSIKRAAFQFIRQDDDMRITPQRLCNTQTVLDKIIHKSKLYGSKLTPEGDHVVIDLGARP